MAVNKKNGHWTNHSYAPPGMGTAWTVTKAVTGYHLRTIPEENILCRVADGNVYFWDRRNGKELCISLDHLNRLAME
jgi:hypothetical protein